MKNFINKLFDDFSIWKYLFIISLIWVVVDYVSAEVLLDEEVYRNSLHIEDEKTLNRAVNRAKDFAVFQSLLAPIFLLIQLSISALLVYIAAYVNEIKLQFGALFRIIAASFSIFIVPLLIKFLWFMLFDLDYTLEEYRRYNFGSLVFLYSPESNPYWVRAIFEIVTIFDIIYWLLITYGLNKQLNLKFAKVFTWVLCSHLAFSILSFAFKVYWNMTVFGT